MIDRAKEADSFGQTVASLYRYRELLKNLVLKDLKLKYRGSVLGLLWSLVNPLLMVAVYTFAFRVVMTIHEEGFVFYLMVGLLAWTFFTNAVLGGAGAIVDNGSLVKSVFFPRAILPVASVLFNFAQYLISAVVFLPLLLLLFRVPLAAPMLLYPVFLFLQLLFTIGLALLLATATSFFRDVRHFLEVGLAALFWLTPVVYHVDQIPESLRPLILLSPMSPFVAAYQTIFYYGEWPSASLWMLTVGYTVVAVLAGMALMLRHEDQFSEQV